jgi:polysaccharide deacetylase family protein (PEP-CTERM system associated)
MTTFLLTIDVEDWFQVENLRQCSPVTTWDQKELRVEKNTHAILDLFDSVNANVKATFFVLGWIAERLPLLVKEITNRGHEVASHGYGHSLCSSLSTDEFKSDILTSKTLLEDITGQLIKGYRAPNFSIEQKYLEVIAENGFLYDSSYNSFGSHGRYGKIDLSGYKKIEVARHKNNTFFELPISNLELCGKVIPWGGGGYFRLIPPVIFNKGISTILKHESTYMFYLHPWEIDAGQPRVNEIPKSYQFRHYLNLNKTAARLKNMIERFRSSEFKTCSQYLLDLQAAQVIHL